MNNTYFSNRREPTKTGYAVGYHWELESEMAKGEMWEEANKVAMHMVVKVFGNTENKVIDIRFPVSFYPIYRCIFKALVKNPETFILEKIKGVPLEYSFSIPGMR
jgi:hypothetical protein